VIRLVEFVQFGAVSKASQGPLPDTHHAARDFLADRAGIRRLSTMRGPPGVPRPSARRVFEAMAVVAQVCHERLRDPKNAEVLQWLKSQYGINDETIDRLLIGYCDDPSIFDEVVLRGIEAQLLHATGFFRTSNEGIHNYFDRRVVFFYWSHGLPSYAIGRRTPRSGDEAYEKAKYKKLALYDAEKRPYVSPAIENPTLYGDGILGERPEQVILAEGITDAIAAQQAGFATVSPVTVRLKAAELDGVAKKLMGVKTVFVVLDNELSGVGNKAALDVATELEARGVTCKVVELPFGESQQAARAAFEALLGKERMSEYMGAPPQRRKALLDGAFSESPQDLERAKKVVAASKIDLCEFLRENPGKSSLEGVLQTAKRPVEILIDQVERKEDKADQLVAIESLLLIVTRQPKPLQSEYLRRIRVRFELPGTLKDLRQYASEARKRSKASRSKSQPIVIELNDYYLGDCFARDHGEDVRYCDEADKWFEWDGARWKGDDSLSVEQRARSTIEPIGREAERRAAEAARGGDDSQARALAGFAKRALSMTGISAALEVSAGTGRTGESRICLPRAAFDGHARTKHLINCENGVLDLRTGDMLGHEESKGLYITKLAPVDYVPGAACPRFLEALDRIFEADIDSSRCARVIELLQLALGYCLLGEQTHHIVFLLYGPEGRNGKSLIVRIVMGVLGRDYATAAPPGLLREKRGETHPTELADLHGKRFVAVVETSRGEKLNESLLKSLSGGDMVKARRMREDFWEFEPTHHLWIVTNNLPRVDPDDRAVWSRFRAVPFRRRFLKPEDEGYEESPAVCRADDSLADRILEREREGVFAWMVEGCRKYLKAGEVPNPQESREVLREYRADNDPVGEWIGDVCETAGATENERLALPPDWHGPIGDLHLAYKAWQEYLGERPMSSNALSRALNKRGFPATKHGHDGTRCRAGIRVRRGEAPRPVGDSPNAPGTPADLLLRPCSESGQDEYAREERLAIQAEEDPPQDYETGERHP
jgi:P4 family phage/plasmid primase-like protien